MTDAERTAYIRSVVDRAPCLDPEDVRRVRSLLPLRGTGIVRRASVPRHEAVRSRAA